MKTLLFAIACAFLVTLVSCRNETEESEAMTDDSQGHSTRSSKAERENYAANREARSGRAKDNINDLPDSLMATLNSPMPEWLKIGESISTQSTEVSTPELASSGHFQRGPFGSRDVLDIDGKQLNLNDTWKQVSWVSINPSRSRIALQLANESQIREVDSEGNVSSEASDLPMINYDAERRWFFGSWQWISDNELIAPMNIQSTDGYSVVSSNLYLFNANNKTLSQVSISTKNNYIEEGGIEVRVVSNRKVLLDIGGEFFEITIPSEVSD
jgi:hypothetical protein